MVEYDSSACTGCGQCAMACSPGCFVFSGDGPVELKYPDGCNSCGHCVAICPAGALTLPEFRAGEFSPRTRPAIEPESLLSLMKERRSYRVYEERQVPDDIIRKFLDAACHAGTSSNGRSEGFIVLQDRRKMEELELLSVDVLWKAGIRFLGNRILQLVLAKFVSREMIRQYLAYYERMKRRRAENGGKGMIFRNAPTVIIVHGMKRNLLAGANGAIALRNIELLAESMGLGTCWVGFLPNAAARSRKINRFLDIPGERTVVGALMVGYPVLRYGKTIPRKDRTSAWIR